MCEYLLMPLKNSLIIKCKNIYEETVHEEEVKMPNKHVKRFQHHKPLMEIVLKP